MLSLFLSSVARHTQTHTTTHHTGLAVGGTSAGRADLAIVFWHRGASLAACSALRHLSPDPLTLTPAWRWRVVTQLSAGQRSQGESSWSKHRAIAATAGVHLFSSWQGAGAAPLSPPRHHADFVRPEREKIPAEVY